MTEQNSAALTINDLKKLFQNKTVCKPYIYIPIDNNNDLDKPEKLTKLISGYKKSGFGGVIPYSYKAFGITPMTDEYYDIYRHIKSETENASLKLGYLDDTYMMREYMSKLDDPAAVSCRILNRYDYSCTEGQELNRKLRNPDSLMSIVALNDDDLTIIDLRGFISDGYLKWKVPGGNWNIEEYVCEGDIESNYIDLMDYDICSEYLKHTFRELLERLDTKREIREVKDIKEEAPEIDLFIYRNIIYAGQNRRMWHPKFNESFIEQFGFDPAPYYPLLFHDFAGKSGRYKCMMMMCRSSLLTEGYLKAVAVFCRARNIVYTGFPAESRAAACSWIFGDGQLFHKYTSIPGISMPFAYLYGLNGIRVAAGAADGFGNTTVSADLFKYFSFLNRDIIYRESMNAFVRGINMVFAHLGEDRIIEQKNDNSTASLSQSLKVEHDESDSFGWGSIFSKGDDLADYAEFATRTQTLLRGGSHISEVAIIYPIHSIHSNVYLYQSARSDFEYPSGQGNADYMELMNSFLNYVGIDASFIHPDMFLDNALCENGTMFLTNDKNTMKFKLIVLPSMSVCSLKLMRLVKKFYDEGGKIIATDRLPSSAYECHSDFADVNTALKNDSPEDIELNEIIQYIFGKETADEHLYKNYYKNTNDNGGTAYYFPSNNTFVDGTGFVSANILYQAVANFGIAPDVYIDDMPRREFRGIMNYHLPTFMKIGIDKRLAKGCSMNYIHKKYAGCDIFYITNTTGEDYIGSILLRGRHTPEEWNPYNGKVKKIQTEHVTFRGEVYTKIKMHIEASSCTFIVSQIGRTQKDLLRELTGEEEVIEEFFPKENF